ncbi:hypothetical protein ABZS29_38600 [Kribbella sp. NPDC005582]|uniref:hypothetical protein n=1 Tax=Kribbella sp. NPDC005582 TaxID=3156893 RepID=UPI0033BCECFC
MKVQEVLRLWDGFPVGAGARPIVLMDCAVGPGGLPRVEHREQVLRGRPVVSEVELPAGMLERLQPEHAAGQAEPARVVAVRRVYPEFRTDRGHRPLPAWHLELEVPDHQRGAGRLQVLDAWTEARLW